MTGSFPNNQLRMLFKHILLWFLTLTVIEWFIVRTRLEELVIYPRISDQLNTFIPLSKLKLGRKIKCEKSFRPVSYSSLMFQDCKEELNKLYTQVLFMK